jgi:hypothetical protein
MLGILFNHGLQPECKYISDNQKEVFQWIIEDLEWGCKQTHGCMKVNQVVVLQYARKMGQANLYETLSVPSKSRLTGKGVFRELENMPFHRG